MQWQRASNFPCEMNELYEQEYAQRYGKRYGQELMYKMLNMDNAAVTETVTEIIVLIMIMYRLDGPQMESQEWERESKTKYLLPYRGTCRKVWGEWAASRAQGQVIKQGSRL